MLSAHVVIRSALLHCPCRAPDLYTNDTDLREIYRMTQVTLLYHIYCTSISSLKANVILGPILN